MSAVASAMKDERWGDADRLIHELSTMLDTMSTGVSTKVRGAMTAPEPDPRDRG